MSSVPIETRLNTDKESAEIFEECVNCIQDVSEDSIIYHYTSPEGLLGITDKQCLWATDINYLNDSSESRYVYLLVSNILKSKSESWNKDFQESLSLRCEHQIKKYDISNRLLFADKTDVYVISFSLDRDNLNMWKYYTKNAGNVGYNIGFDKTALTTNCGLNNFTYGKVIYDEAKQIDLLRTTLEKFEELYSKQPDRFGRAQVFQFLVSTLYNISAFFKHPAFADENEFRVVIRNHIRFNKSNDLKIHYRIKDGVFIPYTNLEFATSAVISIALSPSDKQSMAVHSVQRMLEEKYKLRYEDFFCSLIPFNS